jgi:hypothetical protein
LIRHFWDVPPDIFISALLITDYLKQEGEHTLLSTYKQLERHHTADQFRGGADMFYTKQVIVTPNFLVFKPATISQGISVIRKYSDIQANFLSVKFRDPSLRKGKYQVDNYERVLQ